MSDYATIAQVKARLLPSSYEASADDTLFNTIITASSRMIDSYLKVENDFFAVAGVSASTKIVYGRGGDRLRLPPFVGSISAADLTVPSGYTKPTFTVVDGWFTIPTPSALGLVGNAPEYNPFLYSWQENIPYTVSARWGWTAIPQDITEACIQIIVRNYRGRDDAYAGVITNNNGQAFERAIPAGAKMILDEWAKKLIRMGILEL